MPRASLVGGASWKYKVGKCVSKLTVYCGCEAKTGPAAHDPIADVA